MTGGMKVALGTAGTTFVFLLKDWLGIACGLATLTLLLIQIRSAARKDINEQKEERKRRKDSRCHGCD